MSPLLRVENLTVRFPGRAAEIHAVTGVSFDVAADRVLAVVGESGSGKSVTASAIAGLLPASARPSVSGSITFEGREILDLRGRELNALRGRRIGTIFQNPATSFDPSFTIGNQMVELIRLHRNVARAPARDIATEWLFRVGIDDAERVLASYPHQLSGGMRQRVMIAIACIPAPDLLIADEPTTALDPTLATQILDLIDELRTELHRAVLLVTHDFGVVARLSDEVAVLRDGALVEHGATRDVLTDPQHAYTAQLIESVPELGAVPPRAGAPAPGDAVIAVHGVTQRYGRGSGLTAAPTFTALDDVDLSITRGRALGLIGASGSGKSTLARIIAGLERPSAGSVAVSGLDVSELSRSDRARNVQLVFQDHGSALNPRVRIGEQLARPILRLGLRDSVSQARARVEELLGQVGLEPHFASRYPHQLSGGQRQRIGIARALGVEPAVIVLDEPTSALDVTTQRDILRLLAHLRDDTAVTFVLIAHDLAVVEAFADDVAVLDHGRVVDHFAASELRSPDRNVVTRRLVDAVLPVGLTRDR